MRPKLAPLVAALAILATIAAPAHAVDNPVTTFANKAGEAVSQTCHSNGGPEDTCNQTPVGRHVTRQAISDYADSWTHRALSLQYELANDVPLKNAAWVGTHNSFNSMAYDYTLSRSDSNQQLKLADQLAIDVRSVELDIHWWRNQPTVCHGAEFNAGCTSEGPVGPYLDEIAGFLKDHKDQVVLLYIEDAIGNDQGYDIVTSELDRIEAETGVKLYRSSGGTCSPKLPLTISRDDVLAAGAQIVVVASGCGGGTETAGVTPWSTMVFDWSGDVHWESRPRGFGDFPDTCAPGRDVYESRIVRYFEDSTFVTSTGAAAGEIAASSDDGITPDTAAAMMRCGVDLTGLDQLLPDDGRLEALVWSWAENEPSSTGDCAIQRRDDARWETAQCSGNRRAACRAADGSWLVTAKAVTSKKAAGTCAKQGATFAVPRTGYENALLDQTATQQNAGDLWLGYRRSGGSWTALDSRGA